MPHRRKRRVPCAPVFSRSAVKGLLWLIIALVLMCLNAPGLAVSAQPAARPSQTTEREEALAPVSPPAVPPPAAAPSAATPTASAGSAASAADSGAQAARPVRLTADAAFAVDVTHDAELYAQNADTPLPPASTTKMVTAMVVLDHIQPDAQVTVAASDVVDPAVYSNMGLQAGDVLTVQDLLAGMLLNSGGDAAIALARAVGNTMPQSVAADPVARFVSEMNRTAHALGMQHSSFKNPDGRDQPGHLSTARDMAIAANALFQYPLLEVLVGEQNAKVQVRGPNARTVTLSNTNELLGVTGVHGVKTGTTDAARECLVTAVWRGGSRVLTVVLSSSDRYGDTTALLSSLDSRFRWLRLGRGGDIQSLNTLLAQRGLSFGVVEPELLTAQQAANLRYDLQVDPQPATGWKPQGYVQFSSGGVPILRLPVYHGDPAKTGGP